MTALALSPVAAVQARAVEARTASPTWPVVVSLTSALLLWVAAFGFVLSGLAEHSSQEHLYATFRQELAEGLAPLSSVAPGRPVALLEVPRLGLRTVVVEGTAGADLRLGPGHRRDTVLPGQQGVSVVYGRGVTSGAPFAHLSSLSMGDGLDVTSGQGVQHFVVEGIRRPGDPLPQPAAVGTARLVLGSIEGTGWRAGWAPDTPVYVDAVLKGTAQPAAPRAVGVVSASEQLGGTDPVRAVFVVLWLQVLVAAALAFTWALSRWGVAQAWLVGAPVLLGLLWLTTSQALDLLPNVM